MSLTRIELETILSSETASEQQKAEASALLLKIVPAKPKPLEPWESDESGCSQLDCWSLSDSFNAEPDAEFRKKLFKLARERYSRFAEEFTKRELARKPDPTAEEVAADYARRVAVHATYDPKCRIPSPKERDADLRHLRDQSHKRMVRWANDPTGNLVTITSSIHHED